MGLGIRMRYPAPHWGDWGGAVPLPSFVRVDWRKLGAKIVLRTALAAKPEVLKWGKYVESNF